ncbi:alpha/beta hydrolase fold domain-containing protein [Solwaraspora sp. WMMA2056]|uniref:alpha/beta hydrolase fold domain-containing protein n=1 Tax=Solwaraspora sp. WMMA2056 TaxID=3015161 RepID=UPI00259BE577|nr:alpha/beta hydrolase fold domain-containing protein [Solwaraspora sp. WMMA2056]WJK41963.1 alpha/beta hydrolase fold domain-containing protein [Solwaraspora sp. WMMA2056]
MGQVIEALPGDIDRAIRDDHILLDRIFQRLEAGQGDRRILADQVVFRMSMHLVAEEQTLDPVLDEPEVAQRMAAGGLPAEAVADLIGRGRDTRQRIKEAAAEIDRSKPGNLDFEEALNHLIADVRRQATEQEGILLPALRAAVGPQRMAQLGEQFSAAKHRAPTHPHPQAPNTARGGRLLGGPTALLDRLRDRTSGRRGWVATDASGLLEPQSQALLDAFAALGPRPTEILDPAEARRQPTLTDAVARIRADRGDLDEREPVDSVFDYVIDGPGGGLTLRVYRPTSASPSAGLPVLVYLYAGGWVVGSLDTYDATPRALCNRERCMVVAVDYRHAPEHPFPAAHDDVLAATRWLLANAGEIGGDPQRIAIAGEAAGGNMAAATCLQLRDAGERLPLLQVLIYPLTSIVVDDDSTVDAADAAPLNRAMLSWFARHTFPSAQLLADPRVALLDVPVQRLAGLPPAVVITVERDPLRSQGQEFAARLRAAGVPVEHIHYDGVPHEFFGMGAVLDVAVQAQDRVAAALHAAFNPSGQSSSGWPTGI